MDYRTPDLRELAKKHQEKLSKIKCLAFDVDGILTTGHIWWASGEVGFNRSTHSQDGYMLKELIRQGLTVGVISGGDSLGVHKRFVENLKLSFAFLGSEDKREAYQKLLNRGFKDEEILYMGDEFFDMPLLKKCGFSATVPNASLEVQEVVDYVTSRPSGMACAREVMDLLRYAQGIHPVIAEFDA